MGSDAYHYPLLRILVAARAHGLAAIDGPYLAIGDLDGLAGAAASTAALGYDGKWVLHPTQIEIVNRAFAPSQEDYERAELIIDAYRYYTSVEHRGAVMLGDEMIDEASRKLALVVAAKGRAAGLRRSQRFEAPVTTPSAEHAPFGESPGQPAGEIETIDGAGMHPPGTGRVVAGRELPAADAGRVVIDVEHGPARRGPLHRAYQPSRLDVQPGFLAYLPRHGLRVALARPDPAARQRPAALLRRVAPLDQQQPPGVVGDDGAHAPNPWSRHGPIIVLHLTRALDVSLRNGQRRCP